MQVLPKMKVAPTLILVFKDAEGFGTALSDALLPNPSSTLRRLEEAFDLSLERYGIKDGKASGDIVHFVDEDGHFQVTLLVLQNYEPPILVCFLSEVLESIVSENSPIIPTIVLPVIVSPSKLKLERKYLVMNDRYPLYGVQIGPDSDTTLTLLAKCNKPPPSLQIHYEPLACFLLLARALKLSSCVIIGQSGQRQSENITGEELQAIHDIGEILTSIPSLCFSRERVRLYPAKASKDDREPWRALYG